jgi:hypothetical protein
MAAAKQAVIELLNTLPDDCSLEDIQYHLYVITKVKKSQERIQAEGVLTQDEVNRRLDKWLAK